MRKPALSLKIVNLMLVVVCGIGWLWYEGSGGDGVVKVQLREYVFHIPERYSMHGSMPFWLKGVEGLDYGSAEIAFRVPLEEITQVLPAYRSTMEIFAVLAVLSDEEVARYKDPEGGFHGDVWYGRGLYKDRVVEPFGETGWYRLYHLPHKGSWEVVLQRPDPTTRPPADFLSFYVANCTAPVKGAPLQTNDCDAYAFSDRIAIDFSTEEENLVLIDELRAFLLAKVLEWKQPDQRTGSAPDLSAR